VWLLAGLGAWSGPLALIPIVLLASLQGSVVGIALLLLGKGQPGPPAPAAPAPAGEEEWVPPKHAVPFGPFLVAGALEWLWLGELIARAVPALAVFR
jgi:leader peptidase (prepilin peptidase)/N-methyltransferase